MGGSVKGGLLVEVRGRWMVSKRAGDYLGVYFKWNVWRSLLFVVVL